MAKFFNKPQLGRANIQQAQQTNETGIDNAANAQAQQANKGIDFLLGLTGSATQIYGKYQENIEAKNRLESKNQIPGYRQALQEDMANTENFEALGKEGLNDKLDEFTENYMKQHEGKPYDRQLLDDISSMRTGVMTQMIQHRDNLHVQKTSNATSERASGLAQEYAAGMMDDKSFKESLNGLLSESTIAHQVPTSTEFGLPDDVRENYKRLTKRQGIDSLFKGMMVQTGEPNNSKIANMMADKDFRAMLEIGDTDEDYNKLVDHAFKKGAQADKLNYSRGLDTFKEQLYSISNQGIPVDIDFEIKGLKKSGGDITAQDEHKLRRAFKVENDIIVQTSDYIGNLAKDENASDDSIGLPKEDRENLYNRAFKETLGLGSEAVTLDRISGQLASKLEQSKFSDYIVSGGSIPESVTRMFDPAGNRIK